MSFLIFNILHVIQDPSFSLGYWFQIRKSNQSSTKVWIDSSTMPKLVIILALFFCCQAQPNLPGPPQQLQMEISVRILVLRRLALAISLLQYRNYLRKDVPIMIVTCLKTKKKPFIPCLLDIFKQLRRVRDFHPIRGWANNDRNTQYTGGELLK